MVIRGSVCDMAMCGFRNSRTQLLCVGGWGGGQEGLGGEGGLRGLKPGVRVVAQCLATAGRLNVIASPACRAGRLSAWLHANLTGRSATDDL